MFKKIMNKKMLKNEKGLTLIELLAVIVILAIVAAIAIPAIGNVISNTREKAILSDAAGLLSGAKIAITDGACGVAASSVITCDNTVLEDVFEGELHADDEVTYHTTNKVYTVTYSKLLGVKNAKKFTVGSFKPGTDKVISDSDLNAAMSK